MTQNANGAKSPKMNISTATSRLISIILKMTPDEIMELLKIVEEKEHEKKRRSPRVNYFMSVDYVVEEKAYKGFINNISSEGVFIETKEDFPVNSDITLTFPLPNSQGHIRVGGRIVRADPNGIGIAFDMDIQSILESRRPAAENGTEPQQPVSQSRTLP